MRKIVMALIACLLSAGLIRREAWPGIRRRWPKFPKMRRVHMSV